ncbi:HAD family hydrolase [Phytohabitans sp. ZYX-F-186]|uniref:HAD family hydrolase n=1 Tax=Phytohabitans maris TaxID=3071409 RepID=A0ABU0ZUN5_9ACTN|nr:HAD family hydrolase [Phytohabitans sp. ZYX-F-186]MDQ7910658.1 HAD family hydrolase [Phytohabitans sp. ZYX-F-186]
MNHPATAPPITTVVFDADETVVDLSPAVTGALATVLAEMRRLSPAAEALTVADLAEDWPPVFAAMRAAPTPDIRRAALARSLVRVGLEAELDRVSEIFFARRFALSRPFADVLPALAALRALYTVGMATNGNSRADRCGLTGEFAFEVYAHEGGLPKKPAAEFFAAVVEAAGCVPAAVVHVGDSWEHDVRAARAAGLRAVWLNRAGAPRPPGPAPDGEVRSLAELPELLAGLAAGRVTAATPDPEGQRAAR